MNPQAFDTLEFDSLRALVRRGAQTEMGRQRIDALAPFADLTQLQRALRELSENIEMRRRGSRLSFDGIANTANSISRLKIEGAALEPLALLDLARLCERAMETRAAILAERDQAPTLFEIVADVPGELKKLAALLHKKILPGGELDDRASPELARIRRELANARSRITRSLEGVMRRSSEAIQEELVTVRNDRFVIPGPRRSSRAHQRRRARVVFVGRNDLCRAARNDRSEQRTAVAARSGTTRDRRDPVRAFGRVAPGVAGD